MLSDEVQLDMVSHRALRGKEVGNYYTRYAEVRDIHLQVAILEGREVILVTGTGPNPPPPYFMLLEFDEAGVLADPRLPLRALHRAGVERAAGGLTAAANCHTVL